MRKRLTDLELAKVQYHIITGDLSDHSSFYYWKSQWPQLVRALGSDEALPDSEFLGQEKATILTMGSDIVGIHLISRYSTADFATHPYFKNYDEAFFKELQKRNVKRVQALQYFMVDEKYSVAKTLVNFGAILAGLSLRHQVHERLDGSITLARSDIPVTSLGLKLGFEELSTRTMHNVPVSMLVCREPKPHPKAEVNEWIERYWAKRKTQVIGPKQKVA